MKDSLRAQHPALGPVSPLSPAVSQDATPSEAEPKRPVPCFQPTAHRLHFSRWSQRGAPWGDFPQTALNTGTDKRVLGCSTSARCETRPCELLSSCGPVAVTSQPAAQDCPGGRAETPRPGDRCRPSHQDVSHLYILARRTAFHNRKPLRSSSEGFGDRGYGGRSLALGPGSCLGVKEREKGLVLQKLCGCFLFRSGCQAQPHVTSPHRHQEQEGGHTDRFFQLKFL